MTKVDLLHGLTLWHASLMDRGDLNNAKFVSLCMDILLKEIEHEAKSKGH